jgi:hypothetical protein
MSSLLQLKNSFLNLPGFKRSENSAKYIGVTVALPEVDKQKRWKPGALYRYSILIHAEKYL